MESPDRTEPLALYTWRSAGPSNDEPDEVTISGAIRRPHKSQSTEPTNSVSVKIATPFRVERKSLDSGIIRVGRLPPWRWDPKRAIVRGIVV